MYKYFLFLLQLIVFSHCGKQSNQSENKDNSNAKRYDMSLSKGEVLGSVRCQNDSTLSFALYLPENYDYKSVLPAIVIFDSHGNGKLPVKRYKDLAKKFNYILIGSNNSKNGIPIEKSREIARLLLEDVKARIAIQSNRIYTMGFSGGSRVASAVAIFEGGIRGVIGCSAGFPRIDQAIQNKFWYFGIVGDEDFNYLEMKNLKKVLKESGIQSFLQVLNGKHEWPSAENMREAFEWSEFQAMKAQTIPLNDTITKVFSRRYKKKFETYTNQGDMVNLHQTCRTIISFFNGLYDVQIYADKKIELENSSEFQKYMQFVEDLEKKEVIAQQQYLEALISKNLSWWEDEIGKLNALSKTNRIDEAKMYKRLLNYLSLASFMNINSALKENRLDQAAFLLEIYQLVDPENPDVYFFTAIYWALKDEKKKSMNNLEKAARLGLDDISRIQNESKLENVRNLKRYEELIENIKSGAIKENKEEKKEKKK